MGIFSRLRAAAAPEPELAPPMGSGRLLRSSLDPEGCLATLDAVLRSYRTPKYTQLPFVVEAGSIWNAPTPPPDMVVCCDDEDDEYLLVLIWRADGGSELSLHPLGSGDERLQRMPIIGHWKQRDRSLSSIGVTPGGAITLAPPRLSDDFIAGIVVAAGFPLTPANALRVGIRFSELLGLKSMQFLSAVDPQAAQRFVQDHSYAGGSIAEHCQQLLDDVAAIEPQTLPYLQSTPHRLRAIMLDNVDLAADPWRSLDR